MIFEAMEYTINVRFFMHVKFVIKFFWDVCQNYILQYYIGG